MILTCPKCESRFNLLAETLAPEGKRVKCSKCSETWFQLPDPDELLAEIERDAAEDIPPLEDIPDAVKPIPEGSSVPALSDDSPAPKKEAINKPILLLSSLLFFLLLTMPIIAFKSPIMKAWPESIAFYKILGMANEIPGDGIVFDQMRAETKDGMFPLSGQVINLTSKDSALPLIEVTLKDAQQNTLANHYIRMPKTILSAEETMPIKAEYEVSNGDKIRDAAIRFVLKPKSAAKDADNNLAPHADARHHQTAYEANPKSPEHGAAPAHQESAQDHHKGHH